MTDERVRIVGIDDRAIDTIGQWPWGRDILADGIIDIAEFGADRILLDIELSEQSALLVDRPVLAEILATESDVLSIAELSTLFVDRDAYLAAAISTVDRLYLPMVIDDRDGVGERAPLDAIRDAAAGSGFSNLLIDLDGVSRRIEPLRRLDSGEVRVQLGLSLLGARPAEAITPDDFTADGRITTSEIEFAFDDATTRTFPLDREGRLLVRWPRQSFEESYRSVSWASLREYRAAYEDLEFNLRLMEQAGYIPPRHEAVLQTATLAEATIQEAFATERPAIFSEYRQLRQAFVALAGSFLNGSAEDEILAELDNALSSGDLPPAVAAQLEEVRSDVAAIFTATRGVYAEVLRLRTYLAAFLEDSIALVGYTATSTTDLGVTPFDESFPNVGLHAAVISMTGDVVDLDQAGPWTALIIGVAWAVLLGLAIRSSSEGIVLPIGLIGSVAPLLAGALVFALTHLYVPMLTLTLPGFFLALTSLGVRYLRSIRDRRFIQTTFEHYLAPEVIHDLIEDPNLVGVGGREDRLTALFTDVRDFSRLAEILSTAELVDLLNTYLTEMSEVILDQQGTIDKYEGDAIMAFFGAPVRYDDHAEHACHAAIRMKKVEAVLNDRLVKSGASPSPLISRIGINTGDMIVGNLGTTHRINYTVMGHEVNLAARLEGVNKQYGTLICISENTERELGEGFLVRKMDRVRVKGMDRAIRLFELLGYQTESTAPQREALELFDAALDDFEHRRWKTAGDRFETVLRIYPDDGPAKLFLDRCKRFETDAPRESWDGVMTLSQK